jgi:hypothetical protein
MTKIGVIVETMFGGLHDQVKKCVPAKLQTEPGWHCEVFDAVGTAPDGPVERLRYALQTVKSKGDGGFDLWMYIAVEQLVYIESARQKWAPVIILASASRGTANHLICATSPSMPGELITLVGNLARSAIEAEGLSLQGDFPRHALQIAHAGVLIASEIEPNMRMH